MTVIKLVVRRKWADSTLTDFPVLESVYLMLLRVGHEQSVETSYEGAL